MRNPMTIHATKTTAHPATTSVQSRAGARRPERSYLWLLMLLLLAIACGQAEREDGEGEAAHRDEHADHGIETDSAEHGEGRTRIDPAMASSLGVASEISGPATLIEHLIVYGRVRANPERVRTIRARFEGTLHRVHARIGDRIEAGTPLVEIESNESLRRYTISSPIAGIVTQRDANPGEQTGARPLITVTDPDSVWIDLAVFPIDRERVSLGQSVSITPALGGATIDGVITRIGTEIDEHDQSTTVTVAISKPGLGLRPGTFVTGRIRIGERTVPLAVRRQAVQTFRDRRVVYVQIGDQYEVRMPEFGRSAGEWIEVLGGLESGARYVTHNSHLIKADIEKSGASHDH